MVILRRSFGPLKWILWPSGENLLLTSESFLERLWTSSEVYSNPKPWPCIICSLTYLFQCDVYFGAEIWSTFLNLNHFSMCYFVTSFSVPVQVGLRWLMSYMTVVSSTCACHANLCSTVKCRRRMLGICRYQPLGGRVTWYSRELS